MILEAAADCMHFSFQNFDPLVQEDADHLVGVTNGHLSHSVDLFVVLFLHMTHHITYRAKWQYVVHS